MSAIQLPASPRPLRATFSLWPPTARLSAISGGETQLLMKLGQRYRVTLEYPTLDLDCARAFIAARVAQETTGDTIRAYLPTSPSQSDYGALLVNGASQSGSTLAVDNGDATATIEQGSPLSFLTDSRYYVHTTRAATTLIAGAGTLAIAPPLRVSPTDNTAILFSAPIIEGFIDDPAEWTIERLTFWSGFSFTITENK